ncbi:MAG: hypothetical protein ICV51_21020 [Flavisolibacter sp.]|nr:hypothetical protein [Flavisolibacter sp.]
MLAQLTSYLLQYKRVSIPHVGSFVLQKQPPQLNFAERLIHPPVYIVLYYETVQVGDHQLQCITNSLPDRTSILQQLEQFGKALKRRIEKGVFTWNGIGHLHWENDKVVFEPHDINAGLQPVAAHKVIRENVTHVVLVGDQEKKSSEMLPSMQSKNDAIRRKRNNSIMIGWIIVAATVVFILYYFFTHGSHTEQTGLRAKPSIKAPAPTYR